MEPREFSMRRVFPWLRLLGGIGLALDGRKMLLAVLGIGLTWGGWAALDAMFPGSAAITPPASEVWAGVRDALQAGGGLEPGQAVVLVADPIRMPAAPFRALFGLGGGVARFGHALAATVWAVLVWGVVGAAIARIAVVQRATGDRLGLLQGLRFALGETGPLVGAPLGALAGIGFFGALCALPGLLYWIPGETGAAIAGALAFLPLLAGLVMVMILVGLAAGWPLMVATVATEGEDTFDALSRSYSYIYQRPLSYALQVALAWVVGAGGLVLVGFLARLVIRMTAWGLALGGPDATILDYYNEIATAPASTAAALHFGWITFVGLLVYGWAYAYVWSAAAQIYLLLRHDVDGAAFDDIAQPGQSASPTAPESPQTEGSS